MYYYNTGKTQESRRRKAMAVRSAFMRAEEIDQERERSGWNPYEGEEELPQERNERAAWGMNGDTAWGMPSTGRGVTRETAPMANEGVQESL